MASEPRQLPSGKWFIEVNKRGVRASGAFERKQEARNWAAAKEAEILAGQHSKFKPATLGEVLRKYELKVSSTKRGAAHEAKRLAAIAKDFPELCAKQMSAITTSDLAEWRDARLAVVTPGSVRRDANLLRNVWTVAAGEWGHCEKPGPWAGLRVPSDNKPRSRRVQRWEVRLALRWAGFKTGVAPHTKACESAWAFLLALRTAMRAGEVIGLERKDVDLGTRVVTLHKHKTVEIVGTRHVPVTKHAGRLLAVLVQAAEDAGREALFTQSASTLDANWRKLLAMCQIKGLQFRDSRAEALTMLSRKVDVMTLARISGHRDLRILLNTYYRERPEEIAARL